MAYINDEGKWEIDDDIEIRKIKISKKTSPFDIAKLIIQLYIMEYYTDKYSYRTIEESDKTIEFEIQDLQNHYISYDKKQFSNVSTNITYNHNDEICQTRIMSSIHTNKSKTAVKKINYMNISIRFGNTVYDMKTAKVNSKKIFSEINFIQNNFENINKLKCFSDKIMNTSKTVFAIKELNKFKGFEKWLDIDNAMPSEKATETILKMLNMYQTCILNNKERKGPTINSGPFKISSYYGTTQLCLGSIPVLLEQSINHTKWASHPGLNLFTYLAEKTNKLNNLNIIVSGRLVGSI